MCHMCYNNLKNNEIMVCFSLCFDGRLNDLNQEIIWKLAFLSFILTFKKSLYILRCKENIE